MSGYIPDREADRAAAPRLGFRHARMGSAGAAMPSLAMHIGQDELIDQGNARSCTLGVLPYALTASIRAHGYAHFPQLSGLWAYRAGRAWEWREAPEDQRPPLADTGARLYDVFRGVQESGAPPEAAWRYDASKVLDEPPAPAYSIAYQLRGAEAYFIDPGPGRASAIADALWSLMGVMLGGAIGARYAESDGIEPYEMTEPFQDWHAVSVLEIDPEGHGRGPGTYGRQRGDRGWFRYARKWLETAPDCWAFKVLPSLKGP